MRTNSIAAPWSRGNLLILVLGEDSLVCLSKVGEANHKEYTVPFRLPAEGGDPGSALLLALEELSRKLPEVTSRHHVRVVLLPPISEGKLLHNLPPLRREEAEQVVRTTAAQHFLRGGIPLVVGVEEEMERETDDEDEDESGPSPRPPLLAVAAPRILADAVHRAIAAMGWKVDAIVPAHAAWAEALRRGSDAVATTAKDRAPRVLVAVTGGTAHLLRIEGEALTRVRRLPGSSAQEVLDGAGEGPGRVVVSAEGEEGRAILEHFIASGWHPSRESRLSGSPAVLAGRYAADVELEMVPPRLAMERRDRVRRLGVGMGIASLILFVATGLLLLLSARMDLKAVRQYRAEIRPDVAPLLASADSLFMFEDRVRAIEEVEAESEGWAFVFVELAVLLPPDTHLERVQAAGDTLVIEAAGGRAGEVLEALSRSSTLSDPRLEGTIQRDVEGGAATRERFRLSAIRRESTPAPLTAANEGVLP